MYNTTIFSNVTDLVNWINKYGKETRYELKNIRGIDNEPLVKIEWNWIEEDED